MMAMVATTMRSMVAARGLAAEAVAVAVAKGLVAVA
jgi:hypothetical protein